MKKMISLVVILVVMAVSVFADNDGKAAAGALKKVFPDTYSIIVARAKAQWGSDYSTAEYQVEQDCKALIGIVTMGSNTTNGEIVPFKEFLKMYFNAIDKWSDDGKLAYNIAQIKKGKEIDNSLFNKDSIAIYVNWSMVLYELQSDIDAYSEMN